MAGRFEFTSPGAAFTDTMAEMLAQRKARERQEMLDKLTQAADARAQQAHADDLKTSALQRTGLTQAQDIAMLNAVTPGLDAGVDISNLPAMNQELLRRYSRTRTDPAAPKSLTNFQAPGIDGAVTPTAPEVPVERYIGDKEQRENKERERQLGNIAVGLLASKDPQDQALGNQLMVTIAAKQPVSESFLNTIGQPIERVSRYDADNDTLGFPAGVPIMRRNAPIISRDRAPRGSTSVHTDPKVGVNPQGYIIYKGADGREYLGNIRSAPDQADAPFKIPMQVLAAHRDSISGLVPTDSKLLNPTTWSEAGRQPKQVDFVDFDTTAGSMVTSAAVTDRVRSLVRKFVTNPAAARQHILQVSNTAARYTPEELTDFGMLSRMVVPEAIEPVVQKRAGLPRTATPTAPSTDKPARKRSPASYPKPPVKEPPLYKQLQRNPLMPIQRGGSYLRRLFEDKE